jgi:hypothetical protein
MVGRLLIITIFLFTLTACRQEQLSLPVTHAAASQAGLRRATQQTYKPAPSQSCYSFMLLRPKEQRAAAVQARLKQADQMAAALDSRTFAVDLVGDHANVLSLEFPVVWPLMPTYSDRVSSVIDDYFAAPDVEDYLCNSGFAEVRLSARGMNDRRIHPIWTARVTSEGLVKVGEDGEPAADAEPPAYH